MNKFKTVRFTRLAPVIGALALATANSARADITTALTGASTSIAGYANTAIGLGLTIGIVLVGGALAWAAFKKLTH